MTAADLTMCGPHIRAIVETLRKHDSRRLASIKRRWIVGSSVVQTAHAWAGHGFGSCEVRAWLDAGVYKAAVAGALNHFDVSPRARGWSLEVQGVPLGVAVSEARLGIADCLRIVADAER